MTTSVLISQHQRHLTLTKSNIMQSSHLNKWCLCVPNWHVLHNFLIIKSLESLVCIVLLIDGVLVTYRPTLSSKIASGSRMSYIRTNGCLRYFFFWKLLFYRPISSSLSSLFPSFQESIVPSTVHQPPLKIQIRIDCAGPLMESHVAGEEGTTTHHRRLTPTLR